MTCEASLSLKCSHRSHRLQLPVLQPLQLTNIAQCDGLQQNKLISADAKMRELLAQLADEGIQLRWEPKLLHHLLGDLEVLGKTDVAFVRTGAEHEAQHQDL